MIKGQNRHNIWLLALFLLLAVVLLVPGHIAITGHEVDVLHGAEAALRLADGQFQHIDFITPLGVLAFNPIAMFIKFGFGISTAYMAATLLIALCFLPFLIWIGTNRFSGVSGLIFGSLTLIMVTAIVYGGDQATVSMSMYYNRWGWAAVFVIIPLIMLPPQKSANARLDGIILGLMLGYLLLLKATFFVMMAGFVTLACLIDRAWLRLGMTVATGFAICLLATLLFGGLAFWKSYFLDLLFVFGSDVRPNPSASFTDTLATPGFFPASICMLASIIGLRAAGHSREGLLLLLLAPALAYITYQNWGNDTKWLLPLGFMALLWRQDLAGKDVYGVEGSTYFLVVGSICLALITPSFMNMGMSPFRNAIIDRNDYTPVMRDPKHSGLIIERVRSFAADVQMPVSEIVDPQPVDEEDRDLNEGLALGEFPITACTLKTGYFGMMELIADDLFEAGYGDKLIAYVDVANPLPMMTSMPRLAYGSPWYYGGTRDAAGAEFLVVPKCPISEKTRRAYIQTLNEAEKKWEFLEEQRQVWIFKRPQN